VNRPLATQIGIVGLGLIAWQAVRQFNLVGPLLMASPSEAVAAGIAAWPKFAAAIGVTAMEIVAAIVLSMALGLGFGALAGTRPFLARVSAPMLTSLFAVPLITWYPLFMVWFGIGSPSKIAYGVSSAFFPIAIATITGLRGADQKFVDFGRSIGCSSAAITLKILVPLALPSIVAGLRIGVSLAIVGVIVAEMISSIGGVGFIITSSRNMYATGEVYFGIALAVACALIANVLLTLLERRFARWRDLQASGH
jgi:NitT/TauT family transport system permease protein/taurine transport system permease protein